MQPNQEVSGIFSSVRDYPDPEADRRFDHLVGLDEMKARLRKEARLLLDPDSLRAWAGQYHSKDIRIAGLFRTRPPLFIFAGDVGTGKSALAENFGSAVARDARLSITFYSLSLSARGSGAVGEMTRLISSAFDQIKQVAKAAANKGGKARSGVILLIDEADAIAQSREAAQMHHEDRAGVNALIRGVDDLAGANLPVLLVMCTNRLNAIDPAVRRRAAAVFSFTRPNDAQRTQLLTDALEGLDFSASHIGNLVKLTGPGAQREYGYTYSDIVQRLLPSMVLAAYPDKPITFALASSVVEDNPPTPPFKEREA